MPRPPAAILVLLVVLQAACGDGGGGDRDARASRTVSFDSPTVIAGQTTRATLRDETGTAIDADLVHWSASDSTIANVTPNGFVTTYGVGAVTISATSDGPEAHADLVATAPPVDVAIPVSELSPSVLPRNGGDGVAVIVDGRPDSIAAFFSPVIAGIEAPSFRRVPGSSRFVGFLSGSDVAALAAAPPPEGFPARTDTAILGQLGIVDASGNSTTVPRLLLAPVLPPDVPVVAVEPIAPDMQRSAYIVNVRNDGLAEDGVTAVVTRQFYEHFPDAYQWLVYQQIAATHGNSFSNAVRNRVDGLGLPRFDQSAAYGASATGALLAIINFGDEDFDLADQLTCHEMGHAFMTFLVGPPLASGRGHWALSTATFGIMGSESLPIATHATLTDVGDGTYRIDPRSPRGGYTDLELYLFGLADPSEVDDQLVFDDQTQSATLGGVLHGPTTRVTIDDIVAANGPRLPAYDGTVQTFRMATIVVSRGRLLTSFEMTYYDRQAARGEATAPFADDEFAMTFYAATRGRARLLTRLD